MPKAVDIIQSGAGGFKGGQGGEQQEGQKVMVDDMLCPFSAISFGEQCLCNTPCARSWPDGDNGLTWPVALIWRIGNGR